MPREETHSQLLRTEKAGHGASRPRTGCPHLSPPAGPRRHRTARPPEVRAGNEAGGRLVRRRRGKRALDQHARSAPRGAALPPASGLCLHCSVSVVVSSGTLRASIRTDAQLPHHSRVRRGRQVAVQPHHWSARQMAVSSVTRCPLSPWLLGAHTNFPGTPGHTLGSKTYPPCHICQFRLYLPPHYVSFWCLRSCAFM